MAPFLRAAGDTLLMTWIERLDGTAAHGGSAGSRHRVRFAQLRAAAWSAPATIAEGDAIVANWADVPSVARGEDGVLVAHYAQRSGDAPYAYDVMLARSTNDGKSWSKLGAAHDDGTKTEHGFVSLVPEGKAVRAFWLDGRETGGGHGEGAMTLRTAVVDGTGVRDGELVDERVCDCCRTSGAATPKGPLIAYRDRTGVELRDIAVTGRADGSWRAPATVHRDGWEIAGCPVNGPHVATRSDRVAIAWYSYADQRSRVRVAFSSDSGRTFAPSVLVDTERDRRAPIGRVSVAMDDEHAIVSWIASVRENAQLLAARVASDGRVGEPVVVTQTKAGRDSGFPQMVRVRDQLVFAWTEPGKTARVRMRAIPLTDFAAPAKPLRDDAGTGTTKLKKGNVAPALTARTLDGADVALSSLEGKAVLLNLWATWCEPCRMELRELKKLHAQHAGDGLVIIALSVDREQTTPQIRAFAERRKLPFAVWHDAADTASTAFAVNTLPATFLVDAAGKITFARVGAITAADGELDKALKEAMR